jgi:hypothetical protein
LQTKPKKHAKGEESPSEIKVKHRKATATPQEKRDSNRDEKQGYKKVPATGLFKTFQPVFLTVLTVCPTIPV